MCCSVGMYLSSVSVGVTNVDWCVVVSVGICHQCQLVSLMLTSVSVGICHQCQLVSLMSTSVSVCICHQCQLESLMSTSVL